MKVTVFTYYQVKPHQMLALTEGATIFEVSTQHFDSDSYRVKPGASQAPKEDDYEHSESNTMILTEIDRKFNKYFVY